MNRKSMQLEDSKLYEIDRFVFMTITDNVHIDRHYVSSLSFVMPAGTFINKHIYIYMFIYLFITRVIILAVYREGMERYNVTHTFNILYFHELPSCV